MADGKVQAGVELGRQPSSAGMSCHGECQHSQHALPALITPSCLHGFTLQDESVSGLFAHPLYMVLDLASVLVNILNRTVKVTLLSRSLCLGRSACLHK